ncbi:biotin/lipoate--protein ligase family protein [Acuticoccus sp. I52.16.1]|uniref:biotin/lipoate--protein ligase family protein n=1 Tax=Acuticoccus sp. I52.16.1 TaxID=2928472 RepID=UPI001FD53ACC|nr:biotin/lipoate--protein ligase family protein [Acuticoccus sp. I52.16.1]UOM35274.1 biotin/lipoate--protein ligase family protein [Acuticoccus sp. I52.16.1]
MSTLAEAPVLPPLLRGEAVTGDVFAAAVARAEAGVAPGTVLYEITPAALAFAIVLAPEVRLGEAVGVIPALQLALADSLGALGPPEVAIHHVWPAATRINGAVGPTWRAAANAEDPGAEPDWLVAAVTIPLGTPAERPGDTPGTTTLAEEGFAALTPTALVESLSRHMLSWINRFVSEGFAPVGAAWSAACADIGGPVAVPVPGRLLGLDERGGAVVAGTHGTVTVPLTRMLTRP